MSVHKYIYMSYILMIVHKLCVLWVFPSFGSGWFTYILQDYLNTGTSMRLPLWYRENPDEYDQLISINSSPHLVPHICRIYASVNRVSIGSDNGLSPIRRQAIIWTNAGLLLIGLLGTNFNEILIKLQNFSFTRLHLKISSAKWWPFYPEREELTHKALWYMYSHNKTNISKAVCIFYNICCMNNMWTKFLEDNRCYHCVNFLGAKLPLSQNHELFS